MFINVQKEQAVYTRHICPKNVPNPTFSLHDLPYGRLVNVFPNNILHESPVSLPELREWGLLHFSSLALLGEGKVKVKFTLEQATKAQRGRGGMIYDIYLLNCNWVDTRWQ
jgi:hypothetical protein